jgi:hypothetical protein
MKYSFTENVAKIMKEKREQMIPSLLDSDRSSDFDMKDIVLAEPTPLHTP